MTCQCRRARDSVFSPFLIYYFIAFRPNMLAFTGSGLFGVTVERKGRQNKQGLRWFFTEQRIFFFQIKLVIFQTIF